jgi:hypothetical protein
LHHVVGQGKPTTAPSSETTSSYGSHIRFCTCYKIQPFSPVPEFGKSISKTLAPQGTKQPGMEQGAVCAVKGSKE